MAAWLVDGERVAIRVSGGPPHYAEGKVLVARGDISKLALEDGRELLVPNDEVAVQHDGKWAWAHQVR